MAKEDDALADAMCSVAGGHKMALDVIHHRMYFGREEGCLILTALEDAAEFEEALCCNYEPPQTDEDRQSAKDLRDRAAEYDSLRMRLIERSRNHLQPVERIEVTA